MLDSAKCGAGALARELSAISRQLSAKIKAPPPSATHSMSHCIVPELNNTVKPPKL
jgi:hypothetical protein